MEYGVKSFVSKLFILFNAYSKYCSTLILLILQVWIIENNLDVYLAPAYDPDVWNTYALGAGFVIIGIHCSFSDNILISNRFVDFLGKESLNLIIWQMLVLQSLNVFLYNSFYALGMDNIMNIGINFVVNAGISLLLTWVSSITITPLTNYICNNVGDFLKKN